jgi:CRISPR type IV-associated protein Csf2
MYVLVLRSREPISYGEESIGVKTLVKKISILLPEQGEVIQVPVILGNGFRGVLRDVMTYVFLERVAKIAKEEGKDVKVDARVLLLMLSGGVLTRKGDEQVTAKSIDNLRQKAGILLPLNIMGFALSNVMIPSKIKVSVFYPVCKETLPLIQDLIGQVKEAKGQNNIDFDKLSSISVKSLIDEVQMMHKDDITKLTNISLPNAEVTNVNQADIIRGRQAQDKQNEKSKPEQKQQEERRRARLQAIFQREYVVPGTLFIGYISEIVPLSDAERELLALSIERLGKSVGVGGAVARGFGSFSIEYNSLDELLQGNNLSKLDEFIENNLDTILKTLESNPEEWLSST